MLQLPFVRESNGQAQKNKKRANLFEGFARFEAPLYRRPAVAISRQVFLAGLAEHADIPESVSA